MNLKPCNFSGKLLEHNFGNVNCDLLPKFWIELRSFKSISKNLHWQYVIDN